MVVTTRGKLKGGLEERRKAEESLEELEEGGSGLLESEEEKVKKGFDDLEEEGPGVVTNL